MTSELSIMVRAEDRAPDGNLLPEVRKRIVRELMECAPSDLMKPYKLGGALGVSAKTAALLAKEAMIKRSVNRPYAFMIERDFLWQKIQEAMILPMRDEGFSGRGGNPIAMSKLAIILKTPFYYGMMEIRGKQYPHHYEPLIPMSIFVKCQKVSDSWNKKRVVDRFF